MPLLEGEAREMRIEVGYHHQGKELAWRYIMMNTSSQYMDKDGRASYINIMEITEK
jgi:hypothetical protein